MRSVRIKLLLTMVLMSFLWKVSFFFVRWWCCWVHNFAALSGRVFVRLQMRVPVFRQAGKNSFSFSLLFVW